MYQGCFQCCIPYAISPVDEGVQSLQGAHKDSLQHSLLLLKFLLWPVPKLTRTMTLRGLLEICCISCNSPSSLSRASLVFYTVALLLPLLCVAEQPLCSLCNVTQEQEGQTIMLNNCTLLSSPELPLLEPCDGVSVPSVTNMIFRFNASSETGITCEF